MSVLAAPPKPAPTTTAKPSTPAGPCRLCLSVDVEEFFQCEVFARCVSPDDWAHMPRRAGPCLERLAVLLSDYAARATFFVLGWIVGPLRGILSDLAVAGHEIACHGFAHQHLARLNPQKLRTDLHRARATLEDALGVPVRGYRAPTFSVTRDTAWALDTILDAGFDYDSSIFPIHHDRYGVPDAPRGPFWAESPTGRRILEFPPLTIRWGCLRLPVGGGGYLRLLPGAFVRHCIRRAVQQGRPAMLYVHPWELDPAQPKLPVDLVSQWRHRVNLHTTERKIERLLQSFKFAPAAEILAALRETSLPTYRPQPRA